MVREELWEDIGKRCGEDRGGEGRGVRGYREEVWEG